MEKILDKIQKLLNLAGSSNEHEAALAMQRAQKLMAEHDISVIDLDLAKISSQDCDCVINTKSQHRWASALAGVVCKAFGVTAINKNTPAEFYQPSKTVISFNGIKHKVVVAAYCYEVLSTAIKQARKDFNKTLPSSSTKWKLSDAFCEGWVFGIIKKVEAISISDEESALVKEYINRDIGGTKESSGFKPKKISREEFEASNLGRQASKDVNLNHGVGGSVAPVQHLLN